jgi:hypothetical protein
MMFQARSSGGPSPSEYQALAPRLARDRDLLASIKTRLARNCDTCALFDSGRFARHIEAPYIAMWERSQRGEPAQGFAVDLNAPFRRPLLSPWSPRGMSNVQNGEGLPGGRIKNLERISNQGDHPHRRTLGQTLAALRHHRDPRDRCANVGLERGRYRAAESLAALNADFRKVGNRPRRVSNLHE